MVQNKKMIMYSFLFILSFVFFSTIDNFKDTQSHIIFDPRYFSILYFTALALSLVFFYQSLRQLKVTGGEKGQPGLVPQKLNTKGGDDPFLILRFFAFFCVFVTHFYLAFNVPVAMIKNNLSLYGAAHLGMVVFFVLSGYLMGKAFVRRRYAPNYEGIINFYRNRALRILPLYFFVVLTVGVLFSNANFSGDHLPEIVRLCTFNYYGFDNGPLSPLWSLTVEIHFYLMVPFIFMTLDKILTRGRANLLIATTAFIFIFAATRYLFYDLGIPPLDCFRNMSENLAYFVAGFLVNYYLLEYRMSEKLRFGPGVYLLFLAALFEIFIYEETKVNGVGYQMTYGMQALSGSFPTAFDNWTFLSTILVCVLIFVVESSNLNGGFSTQSKLASGLYRFFQYLGTLSYGFYLWHSPLSMKFAPLFHPINSGGDYICESMLVAAGLFILASFSHRFVERPFERMKKLGNWFGAS